MKASKNPIVLFLCGCPGSGKSTFAKTYIAKNPDKKIAYLSRDNIRFSLLKKEDDYFAYEDTVVDLFYKNIDNETRNPENDFVIIDATHVNPNSRKLPLKYISKECKIIVIYFTASVDECIRRNEKRKGREKVPKQVIQRMHRSFMFFTPKEKELFKNTKFLKIDETGKIEEVKE